MSGKTDAMNRIKDELNKQGINWTTVSFEESGQFMFGGSKRTVAFGEETVEVENYIRLLKFEYRIV